LAKNEKPHAAQVHLVRTQSRVGFAFLQIAAPQRKQNRKQNARFALHKNNVFSTFCVKKH
jgi:hypothetical protein